MLFADYLIQWLEIAKGTIKLTTYASYKSLSESTIIPYFRHLGLLLLALWLLPGSMEAAPQVNPDAAPAPTANELAAHNPGRQT